MKTNLPLIAKIILAAAVIIISSTSFAGNHKVPVFNTVPTGNLKIAIKNNNLVMNWSLPADANPTYCEIQGSKDGKNFTTIGFVMGANPATADNSYMFKQTFAKIKHGKVYYRVLIVATDKTATSSEVVKIAK